MIAKILNFYLSFNLKYFIHEGVIQNVLNGYMCEIPEVIQSINMVQSEFQASFLYKIYVQAYL